MEEKKEEIIEKKVKKAPKKSSADVDLKKAKVSIHDYSKKKIGDDKKKIQKIILKLEESIKNHNTTLEDHKKALETAKAEEKLLLELEKQII